MNYIHHYASPLGGITLTSDGEALTGLWFGGQQHFPHNLTADSTEAELSVFTQTVNRLDAYFSGKEPDFMPPISLHTTPFRRAVCEILLTIPYGQTMTYGAIADILVNEGYIEKYELIDNGSFRDIHITLKYGVDKNEKVME